MFMLKGDGAVFAAVSKVKCLACHNTLLLRFTVNCDDLSQNMC